MAERSFVILCLLLTSAFWADAQRNSNWVIGQRTGVQISKSANGTSVSLVSQFNGFEGCGTVSDKQSGALLFYTNGKQIWNKDYEIMPNGDSLISGGSATQTGLILPFPGSDMRYAVFTSPEFFSEADAGLRYSIVDMSLNNGLGDVVEGEKNILLIDSVCEALTYSISADSSAYWLIAHERNSNRFISLKIDKNGIASDTVYSSIGRIWGENSKGELQGYMKVSPDGKKLAVSSAGVTDRQANKSRIEIFDFDPCSGKISNQLIIKGTEASTYACEFSPNGRYVYYTNIYLPSYIYQIDISSADESIISNSKVEIAKAPTPPPSENRIVAFGGLQLHADGRIYLSETVNRALHVIERPNEKGKDCDFKYNALDLKNVRAAYGLPQAVPIDLLPPSVDTPFVDISINDSCLENGIMVTISGVRKYIKRSWTLIDENNDTVLTSAKMDFDLSAVEAAEYTVKVELFTACKNYTFQKFITVKECFCEGSIALEDSCAETPTELSIETRYAIDSVQWIILDSTDALISNNTQNRYNTNLPLGNYKAIAFTYFSCGIDTIETSFTLDSCFACEEVFLPNAFSPNADGVNDMFGVTTICTFDTFRLRIFNRWGTQVFETNNPNNPWDGKFKGETCPKGVYLYTLSYRAVGRSNKFKTGRVIIVR